MKGSPTVTSTPGGIEIGVRPSLDGRPVDAENCRRPCAGATSAGTRNEGSVMTVEGEKSMAAALVLLGASMFAREDGETRAREASIHHGFGNRHDVFEKVEKLPTADYISSSSSASRVVHGHYTNGSSEMTYTPSSVFSRRKLRVQTDHSLL